MRLLTYFIGCSVDGFIAGPDGQCDSSGFDGDLKAAILAEYPETIPDHVRRSLGVVPLDGVAPFVGVTVEGRRAAAKAAETLAVGGLVGGVWAHHPESAPSQVGADRAGGVRLVRKARCLGASAPGRLHGAGPRLDGTRNQRTADTDSACQGARLTA